MNSKVPYAIELMRGTNLPMGFETDIMPLFRDLDRNYMTFVFDLWSYEDVKNNASDILGSKTGRCRATSRGAKTRWVS